MHFDLPPFKMASLHDHGRYSLPAMDSLSQTSLSSVSKSNLHFCASFPHLPAISTLTSFTPAATPPQPRAFSFGSAGLGFSTSSPPAMNGGSGLSNSSPTCMNCQTSTTPLWRRDEVGSVLCNACGLFLKLHGRPRPISLKTDVIKSRNRVKSSSSSVGSKKKMSFNTTTLDQVRPHTETPLGHRRPSQKSINTHSDGSNSPISRHSTPSVFGSHLSAFSGHPLDDPYAHHSPSQLCQPSPGRSTPPLNTNSLEVPQTYEQLIAQNSSLKTRVSELEVINELFRGRVAQLEQDESNARRGEEIRIETNNDLHRRLEESQRRENQLKHRLDDVERELASIKEGEPRVKKVRVSDMVANSEVSTPQSSI
ncbi:unnamed protein product [Blumeria hordei]|uniref:GATA-type domain-containing protein n=1 Tax=Blumeria hordei TaxID=2867405 RepID=A0A383UPB4_BLUHO|nr:unnamed protein product [Blumeria hordei]